MNTPLKRIRLGAVVLVLILIAATVGYRLGGLTWIESIYMVVITVSTVGYSEVPEMGPGLQAFTIVVIVLGISAVAYTVGGFIQLMAEGEINRALGLRRMTREIENLQKHIIICGFGRMGQILCEELKRHGEAFVVIDRDGERMVEAENLGYLTLNGDATEEDVLLSVGVKRAKSLITVLPSDTANVFIALTSRNLNQDLQIIARGVFPSAYKKLIQAGANRVVLPAAIGAQRIAAMVMRPSTVELMELFTGQNTMNVEIDEVVIGPESGLVEQSVQDVETQRRHGLLIVAVKRAAGELVFNPDADFTFQPDDTVIVMGRLQDIERFQEEYRV